MLKGNPCFLGNCSFSSFNLLNPPPPFSLQMWKAKCPFICTLVLLKYLSSTTRIHKRKPGICLLSHQFSLSYLKSGDVDHFSVLGFAANCSLLSSLVFLYDVQILESFVSTVLWWQTRELSCNLYFPFKWSKFAWSPLIL